MEVKLAAITLAMGVMLDLGWGPIQEVATELLSFPVYLPKRAIFLVE